MPPSLSTRLLTLAAAIAADGGEAVRRTLRDLVAEEAPFDQGEIVHRGEDGLARWGLGLGGESEELAAEDLLAGLWSVSAPLRFDDWGEMASYPATRDLLSAKGLRSLLALPLPPAGAGGDSALLIARRQGWGFAAASLPALQPLAAVAGAALARAFAMTSLRRRVEALEAGLSAGASDGGSLRRELVQAREDRDAARRERGSLHERLAVEEARARAMEGRLHEIRAAREGLRAEAASGADAAARSIAERDALGRELEAARARLQAATAAAVSATAERDELASRLRGQELKVAALEVRVAARRRRPKRGRPSTPAQRVRAGPRAPKPGAAPKGSRPVSHGRAARRAGRR